MSTSQDFLQTQITATEEQITAYNAAILAITTGGLESYTLDTGQTRQTVTKQNLSSMELALERLLNRHATLNARMTGCGVVIVGPCF